MKKLFFIILLSINFLQSQIKGKIIDPFGKPLEGVNIYIKNSLEGTYSAKDGSFELILPKNIKQVEIIFENSGFKTINKLWNEKMKFITINLFPEEYLEEIKVNSLNYDSSPNSKNAVLKPFDIKTNPAALGDVVHGLQILPGVQNNANDGKLFLKGGDSNENKFFINGINVLSPYIQTVSGIPTRSRYSPDLFKGIKLNSGAYSTEFGQALSGALFLDFMNPENTNDKIDLSLTSVGIGAAITHKKEHHFLYGSMDYTNLSPYKNIFPDRLDWNKYYRQLSGNFFHQYKNKNVTNNNFLYLNTSAFIVNLEDLNIGNHTNDFSDYTLHGQSTWEIKLPENYTLNFDGGFDALKQNIKGVSMQLDQVKIQAEQIHLKINASKNFNKTKLYIGTEYLSKESFDKYKNSFININSELTQPILANFIEVNTLLYKRLGTTFGLRTEYSYLTNRFNTAPRFLLNYSINSNKNLFFAYGIYYQSPEEKYLKIHSKLDFTKSQNYSLNYKYKKDTQFFNAEIFYKKYQNLVTYKSNTNFEYNFLNNNGYGEAFGIDGIYKGNNIKNFTYWISYSYIKSFRKYENYPEKSIASFSPEHNFSFLGKYWISSLKSQIGLNTSFNSGFYYNNPNHLKFNDSKTPWYFDLSLSYSYLIKSNIILHGSISNVLNYKNIYGYDFTKNPDNNGFYESMPKISSADRFIFLGLFITLNKTKNTNQLENL